MGNWFFKEKSPVLPWLHSLVVPPLFDFPPLTARTMTLESPYNIFFGKQALKCLFQDYFEDARHFSTMFMLKPIDDPHVDIVATVAGPFDLKFDEEKIIYKALFRWQSDVGDPRTFMELFVSNSDPTVLQMRSSAYCPVYRCGAFFILPLPLQKRETAEDYGTMGLRYDSKKLSAGVTVMPFASTFLKSAVYLMDDTKTVLSNNNISDSTFQVAASWQLNKNFLLKGKVGPLSSSMALAFKSWWKPAFTFNISATRNHISGATGYGFGLRVENIREDSLPGKNELVQIFSRNI